MKATRIDPAAVEFTAIRAQGAGGHNVNKMSSAAHLRFDIAGSSRPDAVKAGRLAPAEQRVTEGGVIVLKAQTHRSLPRNQADALARLQALVDEVQHPVIKRRPTKPTRASKRRRLEGKARRGEIKSARSRVTP